MLTLKNKRKLFFFISSVVFLFLAIFLLPKVAGFFLQVHVQRSFGLKVRYDSVELGLLGAKLKNVSFSNLGQADIAVGEVEMDYGFGPSQPKLFLISPRVVIGEKSKNGFSIDDLRRMLGTFNRYKVEILDGLLEIKDGLLKMEFSASWNGSNLQLSLRHRESEVKIVAKTFKERIKAAIKFKGAQADDAAKILSFFDFCKYEVGAKVNGSAKVVYHLKNGLERFSINADFQNLFLKSDLFRMEAKKLHLDMRKNSGGLLDLESLLDKDAKVFFFCNVAELDLLVKDRTCFKAVKGDIALSFEKGVYSYFEGMAQPRDGGLKAFKLEAKGCLEDVLGKLSFTDESFLSFKIRGLGEKFKDFDFELKGLKKDELNILKLAASSFPDFSVFDGAVDGKLKVKLEKNRLKELGLRDFSLNNFSFGSQDFKTEIKRLDAALKLRKKSGKFICTGGRLKLCDLKTAFAKKSFHLSDACADIAIEKNSFVASNLAFFLNGARTDIAISGFFDAPKIDVVQQGKMRDFFSFYAAEDSYLLHGTLSREDNSFSLIGRLDTCGAGGEKFAYTFGSRFSMLPFFSGPLEILRQLDLLWVKANHFPFDRWNCSYGGHCFSGCGHVSLLLKRGLANLWLKGSDLKLESPNFIFFCPQLGEKRKPFAKKHSLFLRYDLWKKELFTRAPLTEGYFELKGGPKFDFKQVFMVYRDSQLAFKVSFARSQKVDFKGSLYFDFATSSPKMDVDVERFFGSGKDVSAFLRNFKISLPLELDGKINGFALFSKIFNSPKAPYWQVGAELEKISFNFKDRIKVKNFNAHLDCDSENGAIFSQRGSAGLSFSNEDKEYALFCPLLTYDFKNCSFDVRMGENRYDLIRLAGNLEIGKSDSSLILDTKKSSFFGRSLKVAKAGFDRSFKLALCDVDFDFTEKELSAQLKFLADAFSLPGSMFLSQKIEDGLFHFSVKLSQKKALLATLSSDNFTFSKERHRFCVKIRAKDKKARLFAGLDDWQGRGLFFFRNGMLKLAKATLSRGESLNLAFDGKYFHEKRLFSASIKTLTALLDQPLFSKLGLLEELPLKGRVEGRGRVEFDLNSWNVSSEMELRLKEFSYKGKAVESRSPLGVAFSSPSALKVSNIDFVFSSSLKELFPNGMQIKEAYFDLQQKKWFLKSVEVATKLKKIENYLHELSPSRIKEALLFSLKVGHGEDLLNGELDFEGSFAFGDFIAKAQEIKIGQVKTNDFYFCFENGNCYIDFRYLQARGKFRILNEIDLNSFGGKSSIYEEKDPDSLLCIKWSYEQEALKIGSIEGNLSGLEADFQLDKNGLFGTLRGDLKKLNDFLLDKANDALPFSYAGKGYEMKGYLKLDPGREEWFGFKGLFSAKQFEFFGRQFKTLQARIDFSKDQFKVEDLKISDTSGILNIDLLIMNYEKNGWHLFMPRFSLRDFRPSLVKEIGKDFNPEDIKPLVVREMVIENFRGRIGNPRSFKGKGYLNFINSFKRGRSVFDFPAEVLGRIVGLDLELLTPVRGRLDFVIKDGRLNITELSDVYSEGKRSKFFLFDRKNHAYVDFEGKIDVSIKMKQFVLFKFTEHFIISITGNVENPVCNLKKRSFFNL